MSCGAYSACYALAVLRMIDLDTSGADAFVQKFYNSGNIKFSSAVIGASGGALKSGHTDLTLIARKLKKGYNVNAKCYLATGSILDALAPLLAEQTLLFKNKEGAEKMEKAGQRMGICIYNADYGTGPGLHFMLTKYEVTFWVIDSNSNSRVWKNTGKGKLSNNTKFNITGWDYEYLGGCISL